MTFTIEISGADRSERRRLLDLIYAAIRSDGKYGRYAGEYPTEDNASRESYGPINAEMIFPDMSVSACAARYDAKRQEILALAESGRVSASMIGIEYYPAPFRDLGDCDKIVKINLTWNGQVETERPNWRAEYDAWVATKEPE